MVVWLNTIENYSNYDEERKRVLKHSAATQHINCLNIINYFEQPIKAEHGNERGH